jgi:polysaccharide export outer membrane protein
VDVADVNGDGFLDIVATAWGHPGGVHIFLGSGDGAWAAFATPERSGDFWGVKAADLNLDGWIDIAATSYYQGIKIWYGNGQGDWDAVAFPVSDGFYWDILAADLNHDNRMDLAATSVNAKGVQVWLGSKVGGWEAMEAGMPDSGSFYGLTNSDLNDDGYSDLVAASYSEGVQVWLGGRGEDPAKPRRTPQMLEQKEALTQKPFRAVARFGIPFEADGVILSTPGESVVAEILQLLKSSSVENIRVEGHAESSEKPEGDASLMALSELRAERVAGLLKSDFRITAAGMTVTGFADSRPPEEKLADMGVTGRRVDVIVTHVRGVDEAPEPSREALQMQQEFMAQQAMSEYRIGAGDLLKIVFWKQFSADEYEVLVRPDGTLSFSMVDDLKVSGLTLTELDHLLTEQLSRYFKHPRVDILIKEHHSQQVLVMGAINSLVRQPSGPGVYVLTKPTRLVELLTIAGGPRPTANLKKVAVTRKNGTTLYVNLYKAIFQSDLSQDIPVLPGDSIFVPETSEGVSKVYVFGEVEKPGIYDLKEGMSVLEAVGKAGSYTADAVLGSTKLIRGDLAKPEVISVDFKRFFATGDLSANHMLQNNDIVYVPKTKVASLGHFLKNLQPALDFILFPLQFEALRTTIDLNEENLRFFEPVVP